MSLEVEIDLEKWGRFCRLWHNWNTHKIGSKEAMLEIAVIFRREFRAYRNQQELIRKSKPLTIEG